jgi:hypothetical protein
LSDDELERNRRDIERFVLEHRFDDAATRERTPDFGKITLPLLSAANWGGQGLHPRGNFEGFLAAASKQKWLEVHGDAHWSHFYTDYGLRLQKRFFGHFLKGEDTGWDAQPRVQLQIRHPGETFLERHENEWPLARTQWTKFYLDPASMSLTRDEPKLAARLPYDATGKGLDFFLPPSSEPFEITGPMAAKLVLSSSTADADVFLVVHLFDRDGKDVTFIGANDPRTPIANGWLRASHRKLDPARTLPYRPYHAHDEAWPLRPGEPVDLDVEIWPSCIVVPPGYRLGLSVRGKDYENEGPPLVLAGVKYSLTGVGPFLHVHPQDRPPEVFGGTCTLHFAPGRQPYCCCRSFRRNSGNAGQGLGRGLKIGRPFRSISKPHAEQVQPPHNICRSDVGFLMAGTLAPHFGQASACARLTAPPQQYHHHGDHDGDDHGFDHDCPPLDTRLGRQRRVKLKRTSCPCPDWAWDA